MKNWTANHKDNIPFYLIFFLTQIIYKFQESTGQYAKLEIAIYFAILYIPFYLFSIKKLDVSKINISTIGILITPLIIELIVNISHQNLSKTGYYDLSIISISLIFFTYFIALKKKVEEINELLANLIFITSLIIIIFAVISIFINSFGISHLNESAITGNQNISSYILLISLPFLLILKISNLKKFIYIFTVVGIIGLIFKSRMPAILAVGYSIFLTIKILNLQKNKILVLSISGAMLFAIIILVLINERFSTLLNYDIYLRLLPLLRIWDGLNINNLLLGVGTGNFAAFFYSNQVSYPVLELMNSKETYIYAHNFLIDRFLSGGLFVLISYLLIYGYIIIKYVFLTKKNLIIQSLFHAFIIGLVISSYDIVHNSISGYLLFTLVSGVLMLNLSELKGNLNKIFLLGILCILFSPLTFYKLKNHYDHHDDYNKIINSIGGNSNLYKDIKEFSNSFPNYAEIDGIETYYLYLNKKFNEDEETFKKSFSNMNKFNKYRIARLHFSSQHYSLKNQDQDLLNIYSDILFKILVIKKNITPLYEQNHISVSINNDGGVNIKYISKPCCILIIPKDMFNQIKYVNSGQTNLKIIEESINFVAANGIYSIDSKDSTRDTAVVKEFLREINKFSEPLKF